MVRDVEGKLAMEGQPSVCELGAGTGVLAVPLAGRSSRFVGVDFAEEAVAVLRERFEAADLNTVAQAVVMDVVDAPEDEFIALGQFDRVLVHAAVHYVESPDQADLFMGRALSLLAPGGRALFGNLPVEGRPLRSNPWWAGRAFARRAWRWLSRRGGGPTASPSVGGLSVLQAERLQAVAERYGTRWRWLRRVVGTPTFAHRLDLVVVRPPAGGPT